MPPADDSLGKNSRYYKVGRLPSVCVRGSSTWPLGARHRLSMPELSGGSAETRGRANGERRKKGDSNRLIERSIDFAAGASSFFSSRAHFSSGTRAHELVRGVRVSNAGREGEGVKEKEKKKEVEEEDEEEGRLALSPSTSTSTSTLLLAFPHFFLPPRKRPKRIHPDPRPQLRHLWLRRALRRPRYGAAGGGQVYRARGQGKGGAFFFFRLSEENETRKEKREERGKKLKKKTKT